MLSCSLICSKLFTVLLGDVGDTGQATQVRVQQGAWMVAQTLYAAAGMLRLYVLQSS